MFLADFLFSVQLAVPSLLSLRHLAVFAAFFSFKPFFSLGLFGSMSCHWEHCSTRTGGSRQDRLFGVLCPDWMKWAGRPEHLYSLTLCLLLNVGTKSYLTVVLIKIMLTAALIGLLAIDLVIYLMINHFV